MAQETTTTREVVVVSGVHTVIGTFGGSLKDMAPYELGALVVREALARASVKGEDVDHAVFDHVISTEPRDMYLSHVATINGGVSAETSASNVSRLRGSNLQAVVSAAQTVLLGDADTAITGDTESMSRTPYLTPAARWGSRMSDAKMVNVILDTLHGPFRTIHMDVTMENAAREFGISRGQQDQTTLESHQRASHAMQAGYFKDQIVLVTIKSHKGDIQFDTDKHVRHDATIDDMTRLKPVFTKESGAMTAGNASGLNNTGVALVLMECPVAERHGLKPLARLVSYDHAGAGPKIMGASSMPATHKALERAGLSVKNLDVTKANEAFATQACAVTKELGPDLAKVSPNGSSISLGHSIDTAGALITVKALHELQRIGGRYALAIMCIGGRQGIAAVFERI